MSHQLAVLRSPAALPSEFFGLGRGLEAKARLIILDKIVGTLPTARDVLTEKVVNRFVDGIYHRECHIPKGSFGVSAIHKLAHTCTILKGKCLVADVNGERVVEAPAVFENVIGAHRAVLALEDTIWVNAYNVGTKLNSDSTELEIREVVTCSDYSDPAIPAELESTIHLGE